MDRITMRYGDEERTFEIEGAGSIQTLQSQAIPALEDLSRAFRQAVETECIGSPPLGELIGAGDEVTLVVSDITRFWMRQDMICGLLVDYLHDVLGVPHERMTILIALGTHRPQTEEEMRKLVSPAVYERVRVVNHNCDAEDLMEIGVTGRGTRVRVNPLVMRGKTILLGATVHHLMSGFGGGRKSIVPGVGARETVGQNHLHALSPDEPRSNPLIGMGKLENNPLHLDMMEAAAFVNPAFSINLVVRDGKHCALCCGHWRDAWEKSCRIVHDSFGLPIAREADIVIASCGGFPRDIDLYQGTKSLLNASQAVKAGGTMLFLAQCREGGGPPAFFGWLESLRRGTLDPDLRANFDISGYIFYAACEALQKAKTYMLTDIPSETVAAMGIVADRALEPLLAQIDFAGKSVYLMPAAGNTVPYLR